MSRKATVIGACVFVAALAFAEPAFAFDCGTMPTSAGPVSYCIQRFDAAKNPDVLYYLHGARPGDAAAAVAAEVQVSAAPLIEIWKAEGLAPPTIVMISWGGRWLLKGARVPALEHEIIPAIDKMLAIKGGDRLVAGLSMGGLNAYLAWRRLPHLFARAAFQCPAFFSFNPITDPDGRRRIAEQMSAADWQWWRPWRYKNSLKIHLDALATLAWAFESDVTAADDWTPFDPASLHDGAARPPAHVVFDSMDQFPFRPGYELAKAGYRVTYEKVVDNHCNGINTVALARFLARPSVAPE